MADPLTGFKLAQSGVNLSPSSVPASTANAIQSGIKASGKNSFQYPLRMMDKQTDYLLIKIYDWVSGPNNQAFSLSQASPFIQTATKDSQLKLKVPKYYITLPIPSGISDSTSVTWGDDTINPAEAFGLAAGSSLLSKGPVAGMQEAFKTVLNASSGIDKNTMSAINNALGASAVNAVGGNVSATSLVSRATGQVLNSNLELLFQGVNLRQFPFTFDLIPRDQTEAEEIKNIIRTLKISMAPSKGAKLPKAQNGGLFINAPKVFQLQYRSGSKPHPYLNSFKSMALTDMSVNYTAAGAYATYEDASPVHMQMTLTFKEINPIYSEDYEDVGGVGY